MSNPIVRYAIARENGFFKVEQVWQSNHCMDIPAMCLLPWYVDV